MFVICFRLGAKCDALAIPKWITEQVRIEQELSRICPVIMNSARYFDHNATTPLCHEAREAWMAAADRHWHNPSSLYREAGEAKRRLEDAREVLADRLDAEPERIVFTSGATEANQAVMIHAARISARVAISTIEHPSVTAPARHHLDANDLRELPVDPIRGIVDLEELRRWLAEKTHAPALVSVMAANNETGVLQPWREIGTVCREFGALFHCDAAQWIGKLPSRDLAVHADYLTGCAHKFGGPKGVGFLIVPESSDHPIQLQIGGPQESGRRGGTEDLPGVLAMLAALEAKSDADLDELAPVRGAERDDFERALIERLPGCRVMGAVAERLWNTSLFVVPEHSNLKWLTRLSAAGFAVSTGSACSAGRGNPSRVMTAMGLDHDEMGRVIRVSGGPDTTARDWDALLSALEQVSAALSSGVRGLAGPG